LPDEFQLGVAGAELVPARSVDATQVLDALNRCVEGSSWLSVSCAFDRAQVIAQGAGLHQVVEAAFDALLPVYRASAWRREDGEAAIADELARGRAAREAHAAELARREAEWLAQHHDAIARRREEAVTATRERVASLEPTRPHVWISAVPTQASPAMQREAEPSRAVREFERRVQTGRQKAGGSTPRSDSGERPSSPPGPHQARGARPQPAATVEWVEADAPVAMGARVRIRTGPFAGKVGTVVEIDARGQAKVSLGLLSARVESSSLVTLLAKE
jgi:hypothetical protein